MFQKNKQIEDSYFQNKLWENPMDYFKSEGTPEEAVSTQVSKYSYEKTLIKTINNFKKVKNMNKW